MTGDRDAAFRALHRAGRPLLLPNAWDYASAAALVDAGFTALGTTSLGVAAAHGLPDGQGRARGETLALVRRLARLPCLLTVDIEAGFSDAPGEVARLVCDLADAGAVGINLEDGRPDARLAPVGQQQELIHAVKSQVPDIFLNARTDTYWLGTGRQEALDETVLRVRAYRAAGADGVFVPGMVDDDEIAAVLGSTDAAVNLLYLPGRLRVRRLAELGVHRISCGSLLFRTALQAAVTAALAVARDETPAGPVWSYQTVHDMIIGREP